MKNEQKDSKMRIILAAKKLFAKQGYEGTSVRQICQEADSNIAMISYHFGGKENVLLSIIEMFSPLNKFGDCFNEEDPVEGISNMIRAMVKFRIEDLEMVNIMQQEIFLNSPRLGKIINYLFPHWEKMRKLLEDGREKGVFHFKNTERTMIFILGVMAFPVKNPNLRCIISEDNMKTDDIINDTVQFVLNGLRHKKL